MKNLSTSVQRPSIRHTYDLVELQQFLQHRVWLTKRRYDMCSSLHLFFHSHQLSGIQCLQVWETARTLLASRDGKCESISPHECYKWGHCAQVLSAPLACHRWHDRVSEQRRQCPTHGLGLTIVPADRLCPWYVPTPSYFLVAAEFTQ
jgi:hypothetical protein